jgi:hypothetical protein
MPPLTLAIMASVLHMQGADATITSDNKGVDDLLRTVREQLQTELDRNTARVIEAAYSKGTSYSKNYTRGHERGTYTRFVHITPNAGAATAVAPRGDAAVRPEGSKRR